MGSGHLFPERNRVYFLESVQFLRGSVFCLPDDVFVFFVLAFTLLESSVHHTGVHIGRAAKGQREMKYDPNSISQ